MGKVLRLSARDILTERWTPLRHHAEQRRLVSSPARFKVVPAGRRSGKTELAMRHIVRSAIMPYTTGLRFCCAAPTWTQVKAIFWEHLKALIHPKLVAAHSDSELWIRLVTGSVIFLASLDKPQRIEGRPLDGIVLDEYANIKPGAWGENVRPALSTPGRRPGWAWLIGVPEGRNHYYDSFRRAKRVAKVGADWVGSWDGFTWHSADIMDPAEVDAARAELDPRTFRQEYEASFESWAGLAYYNWTDNNLVGGLSRQYDPHAPLILCFDFNTNPGVCAAVQEKTRTAHSRVADEFGDTYTAVIGETWREVSNTPIVCDHVLEEWGHHQGPVHCYGDASGGAHTTVAVQGSDWDIIRDRLGKRFGDRLSLRVPASNPPGSERIRVNSTNARIHTSDGLRHLAVDPDDAPHVVDDYERVETIPDGSGRILKEPGGPLTHLSDAIGYYLAQRFPVARTKIHSKRVA